MSGIDTTDPAELFEVLAKLGEGSYGSVFKALDRRDGKVVAIKVLEVENEDTAELQKEINILKECNSDFIVRYKGSYEKDGNIWIVMESKHTPHPIHSPLSAALTITPTSPLTSS